MLYEFGVGVGKLVGAARYWRAAFSGVTSVVATVASGRNGTARDICQDPAWGPQPCPTASADLGSYLWFLPVTWVSGTWPRLSSAASTFSGYIEDVVPGGTYGLHDVLLWASLLTAGFAVLRALVVWIFASDKKKTEAMVDFVLQLLLLFLPLGMVAWTLLGATPFWWKESWLAGTTIVSSSLVAVHGCVVIGRICAKCRRKCSTRFLHAYADRSFGAYEIEAAHFQSTDFASSPDEMITRSIVLFQDRLSNGAWHNVGGGVVARVRKVPTLVTCWHVYELVAKSMAARVVSAGDRDQSISMNALQLFGWSKADRPAAHPTWRGLDQVYLRLRGRGDVGSVLRLSSQTMGVPLHREVRIYLPRGTGSFYDGPSDSTLTDVKKPPRGQIIPFDASYRSADPARSLFERLRTEDIVSHSDPPTASDDTVFSFAAAYNTLKGHSGLPVFQIQGVRMVLVGIHAYTGRPLLSEDFRNYFRGLAEAIDPVAIVRATHGKIVREGEKISFTPDGVVAEADDHYVRSLRKLADAYLAEEKRETDRSHASSYQTLEENVMFEQRGAKFLAGSGPDYGTRSPGFVVYGERLTIDTLPQRELKIFQEVKGETRNGGGGYDSDDESVERFVDLRRRIKSMSIEDRILTYNRLQRELRSMSNSENWADRMEVETLEKELSVFRVSLQNESDPVVVYQICPGSGIFPIQKVLQRDLTPPVEGMVSVGLLERGRAFAKTPCSIPKILDQITGSMRKSLDEFVSPDLSHQALTSTWKTHLPLRTVPPAPSSLEISGAVDWIIEHEICVDMVDPPKMAWSDMDHFMDWMHLHHAPGGTWTINPKSGSGGPWNLESSTSTVGLVLKNAEPRLFAVVWDMLERVDRGEPPRMWWSPVNVFTKNEFLPRAKRDRGVYRDIKASPVHNVEYCRILLTPVMNAGKSVVDTSRVRIGMSFDKPGLVNLARHLIDTKPPGSTLYQMDTSSWDWCFQPWCWDAVFELVKKVYRKRGGSDRLMKHLDALHVACKTSVYSFPIEGNVYGLFTLGEKSGIMDSGFLGTSWFNSIANLVLNHIVNKRVCHAVGVQGVVNGDDALLWLGTESLNGSTMIERYKAEMANLGFRLREMVAVTPESFEFCSRHIDVTSTSCGSYNVRWQKLLFNFLRRLEKPPQSPGGFKREEWLIFQEQLVLNPMWPDIYTLLKVLDEKITGGLVIFRGELGLEVKVEPTGPVGGKRKLELPTRFTGRGEFPVGRILVELEGSDGVEVKNEDQDKTEGAATAETARSVATQAGGGGIEKSIRVPWNHPRCSEQEARSDG